MVDKPARDVEYNNLKSFVDAARGNDKFKLLVMAPADQTSLKVAIRDSQNNVNKVTSGLNLLEQQLFHAENSEVDPLNKMLEAKRKDIASAKDELKQKNQQVERLSKIEAYHLKLKEESFRMADANIQLKAGSPLERQWALLNAKIKVLSDTIADSRAALSLPRTLDHTLIDKILKEQPHFS